MNFPKRAIAVESPHIIISSMGGVTTRIWSADDPKHQWGNLWLRSTGLQAGNVEGTPIANFEAYTTGTADIRDYSNLQYSITFDDVTTYANCPVKIFIEYYDGTFDVITGTLDAWASISFVLPKAALISICCSIPDTPGGGDVNNTDYSPKTGIW